MIAYLALEDGTVFQGKAFGSEGKEFGEVVFNTGMTGYQKILTDPSYCGQIVVLTYPLVGNYGINRDDFESERPWVRGFVIKELCTYPSNWRCWIKLEEFCRRYGIIGLVGIDTRALTRRLRNYGTMRGIIATGEQDPARLVKEAGEAPPLSGQDLVRTVSTPRARVWGEGPIKVVVVDFGVKYNILRSLVQRNCTVYLVPAWTPAEEILSYRPRGVVLSNGPGDPKDVWYAVEATRKLIGKVPLMGICLGHQILGLAFGGDTYRLKFGHRGSNHPVKDLETGRVYITSQNHGFAVDERSLPHGEVVVSHRNLNDGTVEGLKHRKLPVFSVQFHPEGAPGPLDSTYLFDRFMSFLE
ncbi:MAG: glutamine-hydrolyzing carbamoyl-phosphate synthase small subunit [Firmicutes bacterium]|nr:glutamine-hydrolyzing carbamoyl-phosphate synthase small subunit [Bacillota bacterium]